MSDINIKKGETAKKPVTLFIMIGIAFVIVLVSIIAGVSYYSGTFVAKVGKEKVTIPEYKFMLLQEKQNMLEIAGNPDEASFWDTTITGGEKAIDIAKRKALENIRDLKIVLDKAKDENVQLGEDQAAYVKQLIESIMTQYNNNKAMASAAVENAYGVNLEEFEEIYKQYMLRAAYIQSKTDSMDSTLEELDDYYAKYPDAFKDSMFRVNGQEALWASHVLILNTDMETGEKFSETKVEEARNKALEVYEKAKDGDDFTALVEEFSEDTGSLDMDGAYVFGRGYMDPAFEAAAFALEPGDVSEIVESSYGFHIIKLIEKFEEGEPVSLECAKTYPEFMENAVSQAKFLEMMEQWREDSKYKIVKNEKVYNSIE